MQAGLAVARVATRMRSMRLEAEETARKMSLSLDFSAFSCLNATSFLFEKCERVWKHVAYKVMNTSARFSPIAERTQ